jgi:hypothetical protein
MDERKRERKLAIVARRAQSGPVAVAVSLVTVAACGADVVVGDPVPSTGAGGRGGASTSTAFVGGNGGFMPVGGSPSTSTGGGMGPCFQEGILEQFIVTIPPEGVPAVAGQICSVTMGPVESNNAARVTLVKDPQTLNLATGEVTIAPALLQDVVGLPTIEVASSPLPELTQMMVSNVTPTSTGFSFNASWPSLQVGPSSQTVMILRTTFDLSCGPSNVRQVQAHTHVNLCDGDSDATWVSSGDECIICGVIAEMAPSPIVPDKAVDEIGLGQVIRLRLVIVAQIGDSWVVLAEHDGGSDVEYEWQASAGELCKITPDVVLWTPPDNAVLQVAVLGDDGAAVASYSNVPVREAGMVA